MRRRTTTSSTCQMMVRPRRPSQSIVHWWCRSRRNAGTRQPPAHGCQEEGGGRQVGGGAGSRPRRSSPSQRRGSHAEVEEAQHCRENQYPLPSYQPDRSVRRTCGHTCFLEDTEHRRELVTEERQRRRTMVDRLRRSDGGAGPSNTPSGADAARRGIRGQRPLLEFP
jgi:hypothetical protein